MRKNIILILLVLVLSSHLSAQRRGSRDMGGGISFVAPSDSAKTQLFVFGVMGYYLDQGQLIEFEPILNVDFSDGEIDLTSFLMVNYSVRLLTMAMGGEYGEIRRRSQGGDEAGVYFSAGGGLWLDSYKDRLDSKVYSAPLLSLGIGTHSLLGSMASMRTQIKYLYNCPTGKEHTAPWSTVLVTTSFSVFTKL